MKKLFKRNQLMITALAIMLAIAGYLQFAGTDPTEEGLEAGSNKLVNSVEGTITEIFTVEDDLFSDISDIQSLDTDSSEYAENYLDTGMDPTLLAENEVTEGLTLAEGAGTGRVTQHITEVVQALFDLEAHKVKVTGS